LGVVEEVDWGVEGFEVGDEGVFLG